MDSKKPDEKQLGQRLAGIEYENLFNALQYALKTQESILFFFLVLSNYLDTLHDDQRGLALGETVLQGLEGYSAEKLAGQLGVELAGVVDNIAKRQLNLKQYEAAEAIYQKALELFRANKTLESSVAGRVTASIYQQLGMVAEAQRQWTQARDYFLETLKIDVEYKNEEVRTTLQSLARL
jgi:tetratricopeptide (TPR) repeat protein